MKTLTCVDLAAASGPLGQARRPGVRVAVALLCAFALVHVQWWTAFGSRTWLAEARAQPAINSTLAVLVVPAQRKAADDAEAIERLLVGATQRLDTVRLFDLSPIPGADVEGKAAELVEDALRALLLRTPKRAQERVASAVQLLAENPMAGDERLYARLYKAQGLAYLANNELVPGRDALVKSLIIFPNQAPEEYAAYGSSARELFDNVKQVVTGAPTGDLKVAVKGGKGDIWVDGSYRGSGLVALSDLPMGPHRITVRSSGLVGERRFVDVVADKSTLAEFELKPAPFGNDLDQGRNVLIANFNQPSVVEDRIRELRNQLGADQMLVVRPKLDKKKTELSGFYLAADGTFKKVEVALDKDEKYLDRLAEFVSTTVGAKLVAAPESQPLDLRQSVLATGNGGAQPGAGAVIDVSKDLFGEDKKDVEPPVTSKWWFWASVVGGAAVVGGALYFLTSQGGEQAPGATGNLKLNLHKASGN